LIYPLDRTCVFVYCISLSCGER